MIVDCHTHIFETGTGGPFGLPSSAADLVRYMDEQRVDVSVVLPLDGVAGNEYVQQQCLNFPRRLIGLYNPDFTVPNRTISKMDIFFDRFSPKGLKIHPRRQNVNVNHSVLMDVFHWAQERNVTVLIDVFPHGAPLDELDLQPLAYHRVAQQLPKLKMILAHAGGYRLMEAFMVVKSNPNVYVDLSFTPAYFKGSSIASDCEFFCRRVSPGRVLYGSDFPYVPFGESIGHAQRFMTGIEEPGASEFWGIAAARLFNIPG